MAIIKIQPNIIDESQVFSFNGVSVTGNLTTNGNISFTNSSSVSLGAVGNLRISGGTTGQVLSTDGTGNLSWASSSSSTRVVTIADGTSITINANTTDLATQTNTQAAGTLTINATTGTPVNGQKIMLRIQSANVQTFSWNAVFSGSTDLSLPTATTGSNKYDYMGFMYNSTAATWQLLAKNFGF